jgi:hypothetical protein
MLKLYGAILSVEHYTPVFITCCEGLSELFCRAGQLKEAWRNCSEIHSATVSCMVFVKYTIGFVAASKRMAYEASSNGFRALCPD